MYTNINSRIMQLHVIIKGIDLKSPIKLESFFLQQSKRNQRSQALEVNSF